MGVHSGRRVEVGVDEWHKLFRALPTLREISHDDCRSDAGDIVTESSPEHNERVIIDALNGILDDPPQCPDLSVITFFGVDASLQEGFYASLSAMLLSRCCHKFPVRTLRFVECSGFSMEELDLLREYVWEVIIDTARFEGILTLSENEVPRATLID